MQKQGVKALLCAAAIVVSAAAGITTGYAEPYGIGTVPDAKRAEQLLSVPNAEKMLLGTASGFSVFVQENFGANGSDCEGRLAAGGAANISEMTPFYHVGMKYADYASEIALVIVGDGPIANFTFSSDAAVVIGAAMPDENVQLNNSPVLYRADLIDFDAEFAALDAVSAKLAARSANGHIEKGSWDGEIRFVGEGDADLYVWNLTADEWAALFNPYATFFDFIIPDGSYAVINIDGETVAMSTMAAGVTFNGVRIAGNDGKGSERILYNLPRATAFTYEGHGTFYGSVLAPNADGSDDMVSGAHVSGQTIAKSYVGGIEFGYTTFDAPMTLISSEEEETTTTTTTTTPETTTTTFTTTTTTTPETTTTTSTTTTTTTISTTTTLLSTETGAEETTTSEATTTTTAETSATTETTTLPPVMDEEDAESTTTTASAVQAGDPFSGALMIVALAAGATAYCTRRKRS